MLKEDYVKQGMVFNTLLSTVDYTIFKVIKGNRPIDLINVKRIVNSITERGFLPVTVIINEFMEVIDGQHRIEAYKQLGYPIEYIIRYGWGLKEVQGLNTVSKLWNKQVFTGSYCDLGVEAYCKLKEFMTVYPDFSLGVAETLITNAYCGANKNKKLRNSDGKLTHKAKLFQSGKLEVFDLGLAYENAGKICQYKPYFKRYNTGTFVRTMIAIFKLQEFNNDLMLKKLSMQPTRLINCTNAVDYKRVIQEIYNWRNQRKIWIK